MYTLPQNSSNVVPVFTAALLTVSDRWELSVCPWTSDGERQRGRCVQQRVGVSAGLPRWLRRLGLRLQGVDPETPEALVMDLEVTALSELSAAKDNLVGFHLCAVP